MEKELEALAEFLQEKNNIHEELKDMARNALRAMKVYSKFRQRGCKVPTEQPQTDGMTQTSPIFKKGEEATVQSKWKNLSPSLAARTKKIRKGGWNPLETQPPQLVDQEAIYNQERQGNWLTVVKKTKSKSQKKKVENVSQKEILYELGKSGTDTPELQAAIASTLKESATVMSLTHKVAQNIKD